MQLFIEGQEVDVNESFSTLLTAAIDDVKNFGSKETTFSKTIILPGTKRNNILFGNIFNTSTRSDYNPALPNYGYNFNAAVSASCIVFNGNIQQVKGVVRLLQINIDNAFIDYEVAIVGELGGLIMKLGANKLTDLDFSAYDHTYSIANIVASWANENAGAGYIYPHFDYGTYSVLKHDWKVGTFRPALFAKEYIEKIFTAAGYTYDCSLFSTDRFKRLGVPHNQKKLVRKTSDFASAFKTAGPVLFADGIDTPVDKSPIPITTIQVASNFIDYSGAGAYEYSGATAVSVGYIAHVSGVIESSASTDFHIGVKGNVADGYGSGQFIEFQTINHLGGGDVSFDFDFEGTAVLGTGDILKLYACTDSAIASTGQTILLTVTISSFTITGSTPVLADVDLGDPVTINDTIPQNILQKDFFSSILKLFNLYVTENIFDEKHLIITPFIDFHDGTVEDWSAKVDRSKPRSIKPMSELNARYYEFKYKEDSDYYNDLYKKRYNEGYGSRIFDSEFQFTNEKATIELIFAPTVLVGYGGEEKVYGTVFKQSNNNEETIDSVIRLVQFKKVTGVASWDIKDTIGTTTLHTGTEYLYAGHFDDPDAPTNDLNFGVSKELFFVLAGGALNVNQFNLYYSSYMAEITDKDSKLLSCTLKLSKSDWYNLSFSKYKWIDGDLWRLNKIVDYNATNEDICKGEFIKLIYKTY